MRRKLLTKNVLFGRIKENSQCFENISGWTKIYFVKAQMTVTNWFYWMQRFVGEIGNKFMMSFPLKNLKLPKFERTIFSQQHLAVAVSPLCTTIRAGLCFYSLNKTQDLRSNFANLIFRKKVRPEFLNLQTWNERSLGSPVRSACSFRDGP